MKRSYKIGLLLGAACITVVFFLRETPEQKYARHIDRGTNYLEAEDFDKARLEFKNAAQLSPKNAAPLYNLGLVSEAQGDIRNAFAYFLRAEEQDSHYKPVLLRIANYMLAAEQYELMTKRLNTVLTDSPGDPEAHALHAALMLRQNNFMETEREARQALEKDPANVTASSVLAGLYHAQGKTADAVAAVDKAIDKNPKNLSLYILKATLYEKPLDLPKIRETYEQLFKVQPKNGPLRVKLADIYINAEKLDDAENVLREGIAALPDDWYLKQKLSEFLDRYRSFDAAEKQIAAYMKAYPQKDELYFWLADLYLKHDAVDKAMGVLQQIVAQNKSDRSSLNASTSLARIHFVKGDKEQTKTIINEVLKKSPSNRDAQILRATIAADEGMLDKSVSDLRLVLHNRPKDKDALHLLSEVLLQQNRIDLAIETMQQLLDVDPTNLEAQVRLAQMYNANGDSSRAIELLSGITKTNPEYAIGWESLARVAIERKDVATARSAIRNLGTLKDSALTSGFLEGQALASSGERDKAMASYKKVIDADPNAAVAEHAVLSLIEMSNTKELLTQTTGYLASLNTSNNAIITMLGECQMQLGEFDVAASSFDKAIASRAVGQASYISRAKLYLKDGKPDQAIALLTQASAINSADPSAQIAIAEIYINQNEQKKAIPVLGSILDKNPELFIVANNYAAIIADFEYDNPELLEKGRQVAERFSGDKQPALLDTLSWVYYRQGKYALAEVTMLRLLSETNELTPEMHYHYGAILAKLDKKRKAKEQLQKAIDSSVNFTGLAHAKETLKNL